MSDRDTLIRLAATLPAGSAERRTLLAAVSKSASPTGDVLKSLRTMFYEIDNETAGGLSDLLSALDSFAKGLTALVAQLKPLRKEYEDAVEEYLSLEGESAGDVENALAMDQAQAKILILLDPVLEAIRGVH